MSFRYLRYVCNTYAILIGALIVFKKANPIRYRAEGDVMSDITNTAGNKMNQAKKSKE